MQVSIWTGDGKTDGMDDLGLSAAIIRLGAALYNEVQVSARIDNRVGVMGRCCIQLDSAGRVRLRNI